MPRDLQVVFLDVHLRWRALFGSCSHFVVMEDGTGNDNQLPIDSLAGILRSGFGVDGYSVVGGYYDRS